VIVMRTFDYVCDRRTTKVQFRICDGVAQFCTACQDTLSVRASVTVS